MKAIFRFFATLVLIPLAFLASVGALPVQGAVTENEPPVSMPVELGPAARGGSVSSGTGGVAVGGSVSSGTPIPTPGPAPAPNPTPSPGEEQAGCAPQYLGVCIPPFPPDLDCPEISARNFAVPGADPHGLDGDDDGIGCESRGESRQPEVAEPAQPRPAQQMATTGSTTQRGALAGLALVMVGLVVVITERKFAT